MKDSGEKKGEPPEWNWEFALKTAILIGLSLEEFDYMTPYEMTLYLEAYEERTEAELKEQLSLVWLGEYYHRVKKLPSLDQELKKVSKRKGQKKIMSDEEMLNVVKMLNAKFNGTVTTSSESPSPE